MKEIGGVVLVVVGIFWLFVITAIAARGDKCPQPQPKPAVVILQVPATWTEAKRVEFMRCVDVLDPGAKDLEKRIVDCAGQTP